MIYNPGLKFEDEICVADSRVNFELVNYLTLCDKKYKNCVQASHILIYCKHNYPILKVYNPKALILMQIRFDGHLGFPGGVVDEGENPEIALARELNEEMNIPNTFSIELEDRKFIHYSEEKKLLLHFFIKEVSPEFFREIELKSIRSKEFGNEVLGILRVPLYTMCDGYRGFPAFLKNKFIGNSKKQLLESLKYCKLMTQQEMDKALRAVPVYDKTTAKMDLNAEEVFLKKHKVED